jgi:NAD(P)-dependent dehydrogenase (short-subunit alcohol dehydrogenase family)
MSHPSLKGRVCLVTGGSRGLGREMALALAEAGAALVLTGASDSPALRATAADCEALGAEVLALAADAADHDACQAAIAATLDRFGRIEVLVNNAGLGMRLISETFNTVSTKFWEAEPTAWGRIVAANVNGPFHMARAAVPPMLTAGFGKIVNVSTSDITMVRKGYAPYGPSKAFLEAASRVWAQDLAGTGVDVNVLLPGGATDTDLLPPSPDRKGADGNLLAPAVMRAPILWLASDAANGVTGGRFIGRLWDGPDGGPGAGRSAPVEKPGIL